VRPATRHAWGQRCNGRIAPASSWYHAAKKPRNHHWDETRPVLFLTPVAVAISTTGVSLLVGRVWCRIFLLGCCLLLLSEEITPSARENDGDLLWLSSGRSLKFAFGEGPQLCKGPLASCFLTSSTACCYTGAGKLVERVSSGSYFRTTVLSLLLKKARSVQFLSCIYSGPQSSISRECDTQLSS
jgi:hypothetical protein